jgi:hypothetical protein
VGGEVSGSQIEQLVDELILLANIIVADPPRLPLPDHVHGFVSRDRSPSCVELAKALLGLHSSFDRSVSRSIRMSSHRVHPLPVSSADVPDDLDARLVVLGVDHAYSKEPDNAAETAAMAIFETRGNAPRLYRNTIVFLASDKTRLQDLDEAVRKFLAWESILDEKDRLDLSPHQVKQAETQKTAADGVVTARLRETYQSLLVPTQANPQAAVTWQTIRLSGQDALADRASKKLRNDELLVVNFAASRLRMEMDRVPLFNAVRAI